MSELVFAVAVAVAVVVRRADELHRWGIAGFDCWWWGFGDCGCFWSEVICDGCRAW